MLNFTLNFKGKDLKYLTQFSIILGISFVAEMLAALIPLKIPASIYGLVIMLLALIFKLIKVAQIRETVSFFMQIMPMIFIPAGAAIIIAGDRLRESFFAIVAITAISTVVVIAASGSVTQIFYKMALNRVKRKLYAAAHSEFTGVPAQTAPADINASGANNAISGIAGGIADSTKGATEGASSGPAGANTIVNPLSSDTDTDSTNADTITKNSADTDTAVNPASTDIAINSAAADSAKGSAGTDTITSADAAPGFASDDAVTEPAGSVDAGEIIDEMLKHEALSEDEK